ncbi:hypothetical protein EC973_001246 [Apophysomyces ossiformis]|uniref:Uncharacterized protein n=1 Tax=Apophysomyces ossiformis TaxID=679940 RepID=A0A8H7EPF6_9FUNG|nr:hypothetical protein EC973_001246 [Apophysomyces ossiformis]
MTKASVARANATAANMRSSQATSQTPKKRSSTSTTSLNKRPAWDMRGKISDMEQLMKMNREKLGELEKFRLELETTVENKESQAKEALRREAEIKIELQTLQLRHTQEIENLNAQQRIHRQELEDNSLIFKRRVTNLEIEVGEAQRQFDHIQYRLNSEKRENETLQATISQTSTSFAEIEAEMRNIRLKLERSQDMLLEKERLIQSLTVELKDDMAKAEELDGKLEKEIASRQGLVEIIRELENNAGKKA